jgi:hypothetical protein
MEMGGHLHDPEVLPPEKEPTGIPWIEGCVNKTADLDTAEKRKSLLLPLPRIEPLPQ